MTSSGNIADTNNSRETNSKGLATVSVSENIGNSIPNSNDLPKEGQSQSKASILHNSNKNSNPSNDVNKFRGTDLEDPSSGLDVVNLKRIIEEYQTP